jgi:hypothetical protein
MIILVYHETAQENILPACSQPELGAPLELFYPSSHLHWLMTRQVLTFASMELNDI